MEKKNFKKNLSTQEGVCYNPTIVAVCYDADLLNAFF